MIRIPAVIVLVAASSVGAFAAEWPAKPVRLVVPFAAGGAADTMGRLHAEALTAAFGKQFYVENRVGGGGLVGTEAVARAEPDGLTLMVSGIPTHVLGPAMNKRMSASIPCATSLTSRISAARPTCWSRIPRSA